MTRRLLLPALAALALAAPAQAATTKTLSSPRAVERACTVGLLDGRAGVATTNFTAPRDGTVFAHLDGSGRKGDWDLVAYDSAGTMITGSLGFRANEIVEVHLRKGARITLQACRQSGRGATVPLRVEFTGVDFERFAQKGPTRLVEVNVPSLWHIDFLEELGLDVTHDIHDGHARVMLYGDKDLEKLANTGFGFEVVRDDMAAAERAFRAQDRRWRAGLPGRRSGLPSGRTDYRTYEDVQQELKELVAKYPDLVRPFTLKTKTFEGRDIPAVEIARDVNSEDDGRPVVFLNGIHHAREWPATEVLMEFAHDVLKNHNETPQFARILREVRIVLQPYTNIDGFLVSRNAPRQEQMDPTGLGTVATGVVLLGGSFGYKRKNCNPYPSAYTGQPCESSVGTDNNRNYPHTWGGGGASTNPNDQSYRGQGPGSEPETKAVQELQLSMNSTVLISMHNIAAKVLRPPGTEAEGFAPDEPSLLELGQRMADPTGYANERGFQLYDVTGGTKDWAYAATGAYGYTVETGPADGDFHGPYEEVVVGQYTGTDDLAGRGMREALIAASLWTREDRYHAKITGRAPAGRTLRLTKSFMTLTSPVCTVAGVSPLSTTQTSPDECIQPGDVIEVPEKIDITTKVPASGRFTWWNNPSTRPYSKTPETYKLTCEDGGKVIQEMDISIARGQTVNVDLPCGGTLVGDAKPRAAVKLTVGKAKRSGKAVAVRLTAKGGTLSRLKVTLLKGKRAVGKASLKRLKGSKTVKIKVKRKIAKGRYTVRVTGGGLKKAVSKKITLK